jgi:hypothetical protein
MNNLDELLNFRDPSHLPNKKFACAFISNRHPVRIRAIELMGRRNNVDIFGAVVNRPVKEKISVAQNYKYSFCFENDLYPGYVTEKLFDAYTCGTIPLYWGDLGKNEIINEKAFLNLRNFNSIEDFVNKISDLDDTAMLEIAAEPLLLKRPNMSQIENLILD